MTMLDSRNARPYLPALAPGDLIMYANDSILESTSTPACTLQVGRGGFDLGFDARTSRRPTF
jgi:hypothetical protein